MIRRGMAIWHGTIECGDGAISTESGAIHDLPYSYRARYGDAPGTNPEELLGAAHAGCFTMALARELAKLGFAPKVLEAVSEVKFEKVDSGFAITGVLLKLLADIPQIDDRQFLEIARHAKTVCPLLKLIKAPIDLDVSLEGAGCASLYRM